MSYIETLFKFGDYDFPLKYIKIDTFDCSPNQRQDLDSYTDANGLTHRNALSHYKTEIKFKTRQLKFHEFEEIMRNITKNYISKDARDAYCDYYNWEYNRIEKHKHFYLDPSLKVRMINMLNDGTYANGDLITAGTIRLVGEIEWTFIEY